MADRVVGFTIEVGGTESEIQKTGDLKRQLLDLTTAINENKEATKGNTGATKASAETVGKMEAQQKALRSEIGKNQKATVDQIKANNSAAGSYDELSAETRVLRSRLRALPDAFDDSNEAAQGLTKQIAQNEQKLKDFDSAIGQNFRNVGNYKEAIGDVADELLGAAGAQGNLSGIVGAFAPAAIGAFAAGAVVSFGVALNDVVDEFVVLRGEAGKLTATTGAALDSIVAKAKSTATVFDKDFNEIVQTANVLAKQMNVSFDDAFELINKGFLAGADATGDFLNQVQEFAPQFDDAGASAEELIALITTQVQEGVFSDKGVDTVKEFGLRIREQTTGTREALENAFGQEFSDKILNGINDASLSSVDALKLVTRQMRDTEVPAEDLQTVIADVFGGPGEDAGLKFLQTLGEVETSIDALIDPTNTLVQIQEEQLRLEEDLASEQNRFSAALDTGSTSVSNLGTILKTEFFAALSDTILQAQTAIAVFQSLGDLEIFGGEGFKKSLQERIDALNQQNEVLVEEAENTADEILAIDEMTAEEKAKLSARQLADAKKINEERRKDAAKEAEFLRKLDEQVAAEANATGKEIAKDFAEGFEEQAGLEFEEIGQDLFGEDSALGEELTESLQARFLETSDGRRAIIEAELEARIITQEEAAERLKVIDDELRDRRLENIDMLASSTIMGLDAISTFQDAKFTKDTALLKKEQKALLDNFKGTEEEKTALQEKFDKDNEAREKSFRKSQAALASATAIIDGLVAVNKALATVVPTVPAGVIAAAAIGITTAANVAKINAQTFSEGGRLVGASHADNGIPFTVNGVPGFEAQGGEALVNADTMSDPYLSQLVSWANMKGGGVSLAKRGMSIPKVYQEGGLFPSPSVLIPPSTPIAQAGDLGLAEFAAEIVNGINDKRVIAVESDQRAAAERVTFAEELTEF